MTKSETLQEARYSTVRELTALPGGPEKRRLQQKVEVLWRLQLRAAAAALKERYSQHPFYAARAKSSPRYWRDWAASETLA